MRFWTEHSRIGHIKHFWPVYSKRGVYVSERRVETSANRDLRNAESDTNTEGIQDSSAGLFSALVLPWMFARLPPTHPAQLLHYLIATGEGTD